MAGEAWFFVPQVDFGNRLASFIMKLWWAMPTLH
jgi:hypothetical protein